MKTILPLVLLGFCYGTAAAAEQQCPICHGAVVEVASQKDDLSKPSKNMDVWNRSICANLFYGPRSYICMKDGYAFEASLKIWSLILSDRNGFAYPLATSIRSFPLPPEPKLTNWFYSQKFASLKSVTHSLQFWCATDPEYFKRITVYAKKEGLSVSIENMERNGRYKGESMVIIEKKIEQVVDVSRP